MGEPVNNPASVKKEEENLYKYIGKSSDIYVLHRYTYICVYTHTHNAENASI